MDSSLVRFATALSLLATLVAFPAAGVDKSMPTSPSKRLEAASRRYLGTRYRLFPLGEGSAERGSPRPLMDEHRVDCMTFVEQALAHAFASSPREVMPLLQRIRYRDGKIGFGARNHYFLADWMPANAWLVKDETRRIGGTETRTAHKILDRGLPARESGLPQWRTTLPAGGGSTTTTVTYIPSGAINSYISRFPSAAIVAFVSPEANMDASHVGFVCQGRTLRHASLTRGRVVDVPFLPYLKQRGRHILGIAVLAVRNDYAGKRTSKGAKHLVPPHGVRIGITPSMIRIGCSHSRLLGTCGTWKGEDPASWWTAPANHHRVDRARPHRFGKLRFAPPAAELFVAVREVGEKRAQLRQAAEVIQPGARERDAFAGDAAAPLEGAAGALIDLAREEPPLNVASQGGKIEVADLGVGDRTTPR